VLLDLGAASADFQSWVRRHAPEPPTRLPTSLLNDLPTSLSLETARRWLAARGAPPGELSAPVLKRLLEMAADAATPAAQNFPGGLRVRRRSGMVFVDGESEF
jgi:hypothetical protein